MQAQLNHQEAPLLRYALYSDATFSLLSALAFIVAAKPIAEFLGVGSAAWLVLAIGIGFVPFAYFVYRTAAGRPINGRFTQAVIGLNFGWVVLSYVGLFALWSTFSAGGRWFVFLQAEAVFFLALFQAIGLRRMR